MYDVPHYEELHEWLQTDLLNKREWREKWDCNKFAFASYFLIHEIGLNRKGKALYMLLGDEGISVGDLERVIEVSFLFGSRRQESQRFGRLMHSQRKEPEHIIIMTEEEFRVYQKRLNAIYERGFRIEVVR